jgi:GNAT superfamily N-acetyltransferase
MTVDLRDEPADSPASRALVAEYSALVRERLAAEGVQPGARFFVDEAELAGPGAAWVVLYADERPVGCGGLRAGRASREAEIKRLFVTGAARGRGYGRMLLHELERRAAADGRPRMRLVTAAVLTEARALYEAEGYVVVGRVALPGCPCELELEKALHS